MNEHYPDQPSDEESIEIEIGHLMDTRGLSRAAAIHLLGLDYVPQATRTESRYEHPARKGRSSRGRPPVGEDSQDIFSGIINEVQARTNMIGAASLRAANRVPDSELTSQERAQRRSRDERRGRRF